MVTENQNLDFAFELLTKRAKDSTISDDGLRDNLSHFLQISGYERTPYVMEFDGFYRARAVNKASIDDACVEFGNVRSLTYPPDERAEACRCNLKGHAVFYCSSENGVPVFEVKPEKGQYVAVASFWPKNQSKLKLTLPIIGVKQIKESLQKHDRRDRIVKMLEDDMHFKSSHNLALEIDSRIADWFEIKVGKPGTAEGRLSDSQKMFGDQTAKPMGIPHYAVSARDPAELIPQLVKILSWHMDRAGYDSQQIY